jgi:curli biogenesis system outer membrane secretion channel CsgG
MKKLCSSLIMAALVIAVLAVSAEAQDKPRLGVLRFTNQTSAGWWSAAVGSELSDMLASELVSTGSFSVLERGKSRLCSASRISARRAGSIRPPGPRMGKIKGAEFLVAGTVSSYEERIGGGGGGVAYRGVRLGGKKDRVYIAVDLKVIDTETGEIVDARTIEAEASAAGLDAGVNYRGFSVRGGGYEKTPAGQAIRACIIYLSEYLECSLHYGPDSRCMKKWDQMEQKRRDRTKGAIKIK